MNRCRRSTPVLAVVLLLLAGCGRAWTSGTEDALVTFYAAFDNDPPGSTAIAHPRPARPAAGGTGSYADPITLAADERMIAVGTLVYYPPLRKYFVMEDECATCVRDWENGRVPHIDLWIGAATDPGVVACEDALTPDGVVEVEVAPAADRPVDTAALYADGRCAAG
jgi:hypothetical protein